MNSALLADIPVQITRAEEIADGIHLFEMRCKDGSDLPAFTAGSHINLRVPNGLVRKYSLCSDPADRSHYRVAIKREDNGRGGSVYLIDNTKVGDEWMISTPDNAFALPQRGDNFIFIAGGIGITPFIAMIHALKDDPAKKFKLYYCSRTPEMTAFREELSAPEFKGKVVIHYDGGDPSKALDLWPIVEERKNREHVYCCGPRGLMEAVRAATGHWTPTSIHFEAFSEADARRPDDQPFKVKLNSTGEVIDVPAGTTILEAMRANGKDVPSSCESGTCGTCRTKLLEGEADHRDLVLTENERSSQIMICVSRAKTPDITIDR
ncbi:PDR/VanB family oxidoreductase [Pseudorhodoplanes sinuspersici]|uniref:Phthalate 4,5-dioxygenase n=1 Tax=Pseudorhodoplanes sinuspersici TaxID=1235591 RepID=A0A1W6ZPF3_9HYPH|nr:PDR/VanB family oxidoreductase [Pseudorhodoplanes sinuspersici]ARP98664.1 phthalate 4,5-dioxygenase [Pseudorhodoplanes sinuspersici]RKE69743.1 phthalate 4,5-dioxygenase reductase subunit [Pseudorhodoplanes sinuspersici]